METPATKTQRDGAARDISKDETSRKPPSPQSPDNDGRAAPSIPPIHSDEENVFNMQRVDSGPGNPKIIQPSEWGAPDSSYRTKDLDGLGDKFKVESQ